MEERRRSARYDITKIVAYKVPEEMVRSKCLSIDISLGGIKLRMSKKLAAGTELEMKIGIFRGTPPIDAAGRVVWQKEITEGEKRYFSTGIHFTRLEDPDRDGMGDEEGGEEMEERRRYIRWKVPAKIYERWNISTRVNYRIGDTKVRSEALCRDINTMGMRLSLNEELGKGAVLEMKIDVPGERTPIFVRGEVAWHREAEEEGKKYFEAGLYFTNIKDSDKERIYNFVFEWGFNGVSSRWWQNRKDAKNSTD